MEYVENTNKVLDEWDKVFVELKDLINRNSLDNFTATPDYIVASYLLKNIIVLRELNIDRDKLFNFDKKGK